MKKIYLITIILHLTSSFSEEIINECKIFKNDVLELNKNGILSSSNASSNFSHGIEIEFDEEENNFYISDIHPSLNEVDFYLYDEIEVINDLKADFLSQGDFFNELDKGEIKLKLKNYEEIYEFRKKDFPYFELFFSAELSSLTRIDSKTSSFIADVNTITYWNDNRLNKIGYEIYNQLNNKEETSGFFCLLDEKFFNDLQYPIPLIEPSRYSPNSELTDRSFFKMEYYPPDLCDETCNEKEKKIGQVIFEKEKRFLGEFFSKKLELSLYPFDNQFIYLDFKIRQYGDVPYRATINPIGSEFIEQSKDLLEIPEWKIENSTFGYDEYYDPYWQAYFKYPFLELKIDRANSYYIFKIFIPILVLVLISWSTLWLHPKELESRFTVSIVCLLSLIAYNFVIDEDLPKLEYLTFMDSFILLSYLFAGIPTLLTVISGSLLNQEREKISLIIDKRSRDSLIIIYMLCIIFIWYSYNIL